MGPDTCGYVVYTFHASHHAYWAEDLAAEKSIPVELVPAPSRADAKCGLGLRASRSRTDALEAVFAGEDIGFDRWDEPEA